MTEVFDVGTHPSLPDLNKKNINVSISHYCLFLPRQFITVSPWQKSGGSYKMLRRYSWLILLDFFVRD